MYVCISPISHPSEGVDDAVGNPRQAQIYKFEFFELILLLRLDKQLPCRAVRGNSISVNSTLPPLTFAYSLYILSLCLSISLSLYIYIYICIIYIYTYTDTYI